MKDKETIKIAGYSEGDKSVGIWQCEFSFDTGLTELDILDRQYLMDYFIPIIWELHDNGTLHYCFSDEKDEYRFGYKDMERLQREKKA